MWKIANVFLVLAMCLCASAVQARPGVPAIDLINQAARDSSNAPVGVEALKKGFRAAGARLGWNFVEEAPDRLVGTVVVRNKHTAAVEITLRTGSFDLRYRSSVNLNAREEEAVDAGGESTPAGAARASAGKIWIIHPNYNSWVNNLVTRARAEFGG